MAVKLLMVEDEPKLAEVQPQLLKERGGFEVLVATKGSEAIEILKKERPPMMLLNLHLPDMSGFQVLEEAKANDPAIRVYVFTGFKDEEFRERSLRMGAKAYWVKPTDIESVIRWLKEAAEELTAERGR